jgi:hypothetical protein
LVNLNDSHVRPNNPRIVCTQTIAGQLGIVDISPAQQLKIAA